MLTYLIYADGGSRNNPGQAAIAGTIFEGTKKIAHFAETIGVATNNEAEYRALIKALELAKELGADSVICHGDSRVILEQMRGNYRCKSPNLKPLYRKARYLAKGFESAEFIPLRRSAWPIVECDRMLNAALDARKHYSTVK